MNIPFVRAPLTLGAMTGVAACALLHGSAEHEFEADASFEALTVSRDGSFELDMSPDRALPLFTAPGEKLWISHWNPIILSGDGFKEGTVFTTAIRGRTTYWYVSKYDTQAKRAQYVRVKPGADMGTVDIAVTPNGTGGSVVGVSYQLTSLSVAGTQNLETSFSEAGYAAMMMNWRSMIEDNRDRIDAHFSY